MKKLLGIFIVASVLVFSSINVSAAVNYAANAKASYKSTDGTRDLIGSGARAASNAIDGDTSTAAVAGGEWAWALHLDLGEVKKNIGKAVLQFLDDSHITSSYLIKASVDGNSWDTVVAVSGNKTAEARTHEFSPVDARYIMIVDNVPKNAAPQMAIVNVEIYSVAENGISAMLVSPEDGDIGVPVNKEIEIRCGSVLKETHIYNARLIDVGTNKEVLCSKALSPDGKTIRLRSGIRLEKSRKYNVMFGTKLLGSFTTLASDPMKFADAKMISKLKGIEMARDDGSGAFAIDGDIATYSNSYVDVDGTYKGSYLEVDFGKAYQGISRLKINFKYKPVMFYVRSSVDGIEWKLEKKVYTKDLTENMTLDLEPFTARYVKIEYGESYQWSLPGHGDLVIYEFSASCSPAGNALTVSPEFNESRGLTLDFNAPIKAESIGNNGVTVELDGETVEYTYHFDDNMTQMTLIPVNGIEYSRDYNITVTDDVKDIYGRSAALKEYTVTTDAYKELEITTVSSDKYSEDRDNAIYPAINDDMPYESWTMKGSSKYYQIKAHGGYAPYKFKISAGSLPQGLSLSEDGKISGRAEKEETADFTVDVTDIRGNTVSKALSMEVKPYRGKWFYDARFGIMTQWNHNQVVRATGNQVTGTHKDIEIFEANTTFNAAEWAEAIADSGARVFNFIGLGGNGVKLWKSGIETEYNAHLDKIDFLPDLIDELHKRDIKFIGYVAPEFNGWSGSFYERDLEMRSQSKFINEALAELFEMGMDGVWFDTGYFDSFLDWDGVLATIRTINPEATIQINPSVRTRATYGYPKSDIKISECSNLIATDEALMVGYGNVTRKRLATEMTALLGAGWNGETPFKSTEAVIKNIQDNWDNDVTYMLVYGADSMGGFIKEDNKKQFYEITDWVKENIDDCSSPVADLDDKVKYSEPQSVTLTADDGADIFYTLDGSNPSIKSIPYTGPIELTRSTRIKTCAYINGKRKSRIGEYSYVFEDTAETKRFLSPDFEADKIDTDIQRISCMTGMQIIVGQNPVEITGLGRYSLGQLDARHKIAIYDYDPAVPTLFSGDLNESELPVSENGFQYLDFAPVRLEAGRTYLVLCEEAPGVPYYKGPYEINTNPDILYAEGAMSDSSWSEFYTAISLNDPSWQILDLKYTVAVDPNAVRSDNISRYSKFSMTDNYGNFINASGYKNHAYHAGDGNITTRAVGGDGAWAWTLHADMYRVYDDINRITIKFGSKTLPTDFAVYASTDKKEWTMLAHETGHDGSDYTISSDPFKARYIKVTFLKPDGPGQGGQGSVSELEIYRKGTETGGN